MTKHTLMGMYFKPTITEEFCLRQNMAIPAVKRYAAVRKFLEENDIEPDGLPAYQVMDTWRAISKKSVIPDT